MKSDNVFAVMDWEALTTSVLSQDPYQNCATPPLQPPSIYREAGEKLSLMYLLKVFAVCFDSVEPVLGTNSPISPTHEHY